MTSRLVFCLVALCTCLSAEVSVAVFHGNKLLVSAPAVNFTPEVRKQLQMKITVDFQDTPFTEVVSFLRRQSGVNMIVGTDVRAEAPLVTLTVSEMRLETLLSWLKRVSDVDYHFVDQAVFFTDQPMKGDRSIKIYDVSDLVMPIRDFAGPKLTLEADAGGGIDIFEPERLEGLAEWDAEDLADIIRNQIAK